MAYVNGCTYKLGMGKEDVFKKTYLHCHLVSSTSWVVDSWQSACLLVYNIPHFKRYCSGPGSLLE